MIPKPKHRRRRPKNNPKPTASDFCAVCGRPYAETHEVFFGNGKRELSILYRLQVNLCSEHHTGMTGPHLNREFDLQLKREWQEIFEVSRSREEFIKLFGKSYLE